MNEDWTDAERLAGEVLASGSDEALRPPSWRDSGLLNLAVDAAVILVAIASIFIGTRPLLTPVDDARPMIAEALQGIHIPSAPALEAVDAIETITAADRPVTSGEPISILARNLEATIGRYRSVAEMHAGRKLPCSQLRPSYAQVEDSWIRYSIARGRTYGDRLPESLVRWDEALYEAVQDVDRDFTASGCTRL
jgi:hypothetical protein